MNRIIMIGFLGAKTAYLNISEKEAIERFVKDNPEYEKEEVEKDLITSFEFDDEFGLYDAYSNQ